MQVDPAKKGLVIGPGGKTIRQICEASGATNLTISEAGVLEILAPSTAVAEAALDFVQLLCDTPAPGRVFRWVIWGGGKGKHNSCLGAGKDRGTAVLVSTLNIAEKRDVVLVH